MILASLWTTSLLLLFLQRPVGMRPAEHLWIGGKEPVLEGPNSGRLVKARKTNISSLYLVQSMHPFRLVDDESTQHPRQRRRHASCRGTHSELDNSTTPVCWNNKVMILQSED